MDVEPLQSPDPQSSNPSRGFLSHPRLWLLVLFLGGLYVLLPSSANIPKGWGVDFDEALAQAVSSNRKLLVAFHMRGCPPCSAMDRTVLGTREVRSAIANKDFIPVRVDVEQHLALANRIGVLATPTYAVIDANGGLLAQCAGYQSSTKFIQFLQRASALPANDTGSAAPSRPGGL